MGSQQKLRGQNLASWSFRLQIQEKNQKKSVSSPAPSCFSCFQCHTLNFITFLWFGHPQHKYTQTPVNETNKWGRVSFQIPKSKLAETRASPSSSRQGDKARDLHQQLRSCLRTQGRTRLLKVPQKQREKAATLPGQPSFFGKLELQLSQPPGPFFTASKHRADPKPATVCLMTRTTQDLLRAFSLMRCVAIIALLKLEPGNTKKYI